MLEANMKVVFFPKAEESMKDWPGYDARNTLRPAFRFGDELYSGTITSNESMYYWDKEYEVHVKFLLINDEAYAMAEPHLRTGETYAIHCGKKQIGRAVLLDYCYHPEPD